MNNLSPYLKDFNWGGEGTIPTLYNHYRDSQNPGLGGLDELTSTEESILSELALISHADGTLIVSSANSWVALPIGEDNQVLAVNGTEIGWEAAGAGDVSGPNASGDNMIPRFNGVTGKTLQQSSAFLDDSGNLFPHINNTGALGLATSSWADLFLGTGAVINWVNGDVTLTHAAGKLTFGGDGAVEIDFNNHEMTNVDIDSGVITGITDLAVADGGTGASTAANARINLELVIGTDVQAFDAVLEDLAALSPVADNQFIVGTGAGTYAHEDATTLPATIGGVIQDIDTLGVASADGEFIVATGAGAFAYESGATARNSLSLGTADRPQFASLGLGIAAVTSAELNLASAGNILVGGEKTKRTIILTAAGGVGAVTSACGGPTQYETSTNKVNYWSLDFDGIAEEVAIWNIQMPDSYDGQSVNAEFTWTTTATSGDVIWSIDGRAFVNDSALDQANGTEVEFLDTVIAASDVHRTAQTSAITVAGNPGGGAWVQFRTHRKAAKAEDTVNSLDCRLLSVKVEYSTSAHSD